MAEPLEVEDARKSLIAVLSDYKEAVEDFAFGIEISDSNYDLMASKQKYLQAASRAIIGLSEIYECKSLWKAATFFEAASRAYLNDSDRKAYYDRSDSRFVLDENVSRFLRSRLSMRADQAYMTWALYSREILDSIDPKPSTLKFMLDIALELPIDAWDCAPCLAAKGNCKECAYGRNHKICSHPGSTYEMLRWSSEYIIKSIRESLAENRMQSINGQEDLRSGRPAELFLIMGDDLCEGSNAIDLCDWS